MTYKPLSLSTFVSPEMGTDRKNSAPEISPMGHTVRVAAAHYDHCNYLYVSLLVCPLKVEFHRVIQLLDSFATIKRVWF